MKEKYYLFESEESGYFAVSAKTFSEALDIATEEFGDFESLGEVSEAEVDDWGIDVF